MFVERMPNQSLPVSDLLRIRRGGCCRHLPPHVNPTQKPRPAIGFDESTVFGYAYKGDTQDKTASDYTE